MKLFKKYYLRKDVNLILTKMLLLHIDFILLLLLLLLLTNQIHFNTFCIHYIYLSLLL